MVAKLLNYNTDINSEQLTSRYAIVRNWDPDFISPYKNIDLLFSNKINYLLYIEQIYEGLDNEILEIWYATIIALVCWPGFGSILESLPK